MCSFAIHRLHSIWLYVHDVLHLDGLFRTRAINGQWGLMEINGDEYKIPSITIMDYWPEAICILPRSICNDRLDCPCGINELSCKLQYNHFELRQCTRKVGVAIMARLRNVSIVKELSFVMGRRAVYM